MVDNTNLFETNSSEENEEKVDEKVEEGIEENQSEEEEIVEEEPIPRKSAKDYIIERKNKKIEKLQQEQQRYQDEENNYLDENSKTAIQKEVEDKIDPILQTVKKQADEQELQSVFSKYPDAEKMEKRIRKYMEHPAYASASVEMIYLALKAKQMLLQKKRDEANIDADKNKTGGRSLRKLAKNKDDIPDVSNMSDEEFDDLVLEVKARQ